MPIFLLPWFAAFAVKPFTVAFPLDGKDAMETVLRTHGITPKELQNWMTGRWALKLCKGKTQVVILYHTGDENALTGTLSVTGIDPDIIIKEWEVEYKKSQS